jgi:transcriptional regulator with XRE-family HTH domain
LNNPELIGELIDATVCNSVAAKLYNLRKDAGVTQGELAETLGIKQSNISRWETPGYQGYKVKMLSKIVRTLGGRLSINIMPRNTYSYSLEFSMPISINDSLEIDTETLVPWMWSQEKRYRPDGTWMPQVKGYNHAIN